MLVYISHKYILLKNWLIYVIPQFPIFNHITLNDPLIMLKYWAIMLVKLIHLKEPDFTFPLALQMGSLIPCAFGSACSFLELVEYY